MTAISSMRLLVVAAAPPQSSFSFPLKRRIAPQPPGPGLPRHAPSVKISTASSPMVVLMTTLRNGCQRPAPGALPPPRRGDEPHAVHALHGADHIGATEQRPPARPCLVHEGEAFEPDLLLERRHIAAEGAAIQLEPQHPQPVAQAQEPNEARVPGTVRLVHERRQLAQPPERQRVEARDDDLALRHQDALSFA